MLSPCYYHRFQGQNIFTLSRFIPVIKDLFPTSIFYIERERVCLQSEGFNFSMGAFNLLHPLSGITSRMEQEDKN